MRVMLFDTETDGLIINPESQVQPRMVEIFLMVAEQTGFGPEAQFEELGSWQTLINPGRLMKDDIIAIHHITNEMVVAPEVPTFRQIAPLLIKFINKSDRVVAHNAMFDVEMVNIELARTMNDGPWQPPQWPEIWCTVEQTEHWFQHKLPLGASKGKTGLYPLLFQESYKDRHRAEADVRALYECYKRCEHMNWNWTEASTETVPDREEKESAYAVSTTTTTGLPGGPQLDDASAGGVHQPALLP